MVQCDIFICHFPYFISESDCYKMLSRIYVHPVDHLYYCLKLCPNSVHSHCHDYSEENVKKTSYCSILLSILVLSTTHFSFDIILMD